MLFEYIQGALESAEYKKLDDGTWFVMAPDSLEHPFRNHSNT